MEALVQEKTKGREQDSYIEILATDGEEIPDFIRPAWTDLGDQDIPVERYWSKEFAELEFEHVWRKSWQVACREEEIPNPGDHVVYEIGRDSFIIVRTPSGEIKALQNACLHRGRILRSRNGRVPEFRCPFHGFTYDLEGALKSVPCEWDFQHISKDEFTLPNAKVGTWGGFIFINMDPNCVPLEEWIAPITDHFKGLDYENRYKSAHVAQIVSCNWKIALESFIEGYHVPQVHPQTAGSTGDFTTQYDLINDNVSRSISPRGIQSGALPALTEEAIYENYLEGRTFYEERTGRTTTNVAADVEREPLAPGETARERILKTVRLDLGPVLGIDLNSRPSYEVLDAIQYFVFPNFFPWMAAVTNLVYLFRPHPTDPESCIIEIMYLTPIPEGTERPKPAPINWLERDGDWLEAPELGMLAPIVNQDRINMPEVQRGIKALARTKPGITLASYQESRIRLLHHKLLEMINAGLEAQGKPLIE